MPVGTTVSPSDTYTIVGLLLTLSGLLATFFSIQLSQWLMNLLATRAKWKAHVNNKTERSQDARRECHSELAGNYNPVVLIANITVGAFVGLIIRCCFVALALLRDKTGATDPLNHILVFSLWAFVICYGVLTAGMLFYGYVVLGRGLDEKIKEHDKSA